MVGAVALILNHFNLPVCCSRRSKRDSISETRTERNGWGIFPWREPREGEKKEKGLPSSSMKILMVEVHC